MSEGSERTSGVDRDTRPLAERQARAKAEADKAIKWTMPDGTVVSDQFRDQYSHRLISKIEVALSTR